MSRYISECIRIVLKFEQVIVKKFDHKFEQVIVEEQLDVWQTMSDAAAAFDLGPYCSLRSVCKLY